MAAVFRANYTAANHVVIFHQTRLSSTYVGESNSSGRQVVVEIEKKLTST